MHTRLNMFKKRCLNYFTVSFAAAVNKSRFETIRIVPQVRHVRIDCRINDFTLNTFKYYIELKFR